MMQPYGSKPKLRPYGSRPAKPDPLAEVRADIEHLLAENDALIAEELRLFTIVDKYDLNGKRDDNRAWEAREEWNKIWRKIDRHNNTMHNMMARERSIRNGKV